MIRRNWRGNFAPFLDVTALVNEVSGETATRYLQGITGFTGSAVRRVATRP